MPPTRLYPPCPVCAREVTDLGVERPDEVDTYNTVKIFRSVVTFTLQPCGHLVDGTVSNGVRYTGWVLEQPPKTFSFGDSVGIEMHLTGDRRCSQGWCSGNLVNYPTGCEEPGCHGLVHANFGDENIEGYYWLYTQCDVCGEVE